MPGTIKSNMRANEYNLARNSLYWVPNAGVPDATVGVGFAGKGSLCSDTTNGKLYINTGTSAAPVWVVAGTQT